MILLVDDRPENIFSLKSILETNGFQTDSALSGEEALKKLLRYDYALIVLDVQMPNMDGFEVAEAITSLNRTRDIPIIFLSAVNTHKRFVTKGYESGAVDYLTKPVDPDILILKVRNFYRLYEKTHALKEAEKALSATITELHSTLESLPQVAFATDAEGRFDLVNQHWYKYAADKDSFPQTHPADTSLEAIWEGLRRQQAPFEKELRLLSLEDGQYYYHLLNVTPILLNGKVQKWVGTLTNIHQQKSLAELLERKVAERTRELLEMNRELELSNHELQQFASVASHDLKEPLRKIQFFGNLLRDEAGLQGKMGSHLDKILVSSGRMNKLINDLLSFTRLSAAEIFQPTDLNAVVSDILSDLELQIVEKKAVITVDLLPVLEAIPGLTRQLFQNLLGNALKFSKPGTPPLIHIRYQSIGQPSFDAPPVPGGAYCRLEVSDNGIGFEEQYAQKIFTIFQRLNAREQYEGTGIGLAIVKKIVEKHNGMITARSRPGEGTSFFVILPMRQDPAVTLTDFSTPRPGVEEPSNQ